MPAIRSPIRSPIRRAIRSPFAYGGSSFTPASLFTSGQLGLWYDASDMATLFQDSAGATPVTAVTQPVGRQLDKSGRANHATQATAAARPTWSARVNLLTKSEQFDDPVWNVTNLVVTPNTHTSWDGKLTADTLTTTVTGFTTQNQVFSTPGASESRVMRRWIKAGTVNSCVVGIYDGTSWGTVSTAAIVSGSGAVTNVVGALFSVTGLSTTAWTLLEIARTGFAATTASVNLYPRDSTSSNAGDTLILGEIQIEVGPTATRYQRVNTASDYEAVGFPFFLALDGVDDGMSTAAFTAGTLGADMDCFIAVRRNSAAKGISAFDSSGSRYFGLFESGSGLTTTAGAGTPTYVANGVAVPGGTATTRAQLEAAVPVNSWVVLEIRNVNLATWVSFQTGNYGGFELNGNEAQIVVAPAGSAAQRQLIRTYLGAKVGLTL